MKFRPKDSVKKFQVGGSVDAPTEEAPDQMPTENAPEPEAGQGDPLMQVAQLAALALLSQDCNAAMQVCQIFLQMVLQMQGQPEPEPQGQPVFKKGGKIVRWIK